VSSRKEVSREEIGVRLREALASIGLSQGLVSRQIRVSQSFISKVARGDSFPSIALVAALYAEFRVSPVWLLLGEGPRLLHLDYTFRRLEELHEQMLAAAEPPPPRYGPYAAGGLHDLLDTALSRAPPEVISHLEGYLRGIAGVEPAAGQKKRAVKKTA
jgi:transcriptional regulator with XRE-family HTH domain